VKALTRILSTQTVGAATSATRPANDNVKSAYPRPWPGGPPMRAPDGHLYIYAPHAGGQYARVVGWEPLDDFPAKAARYPRAPSAERRGANAASLRCTENSVREGNRVAPDFGRCWH
jgi:hypothetical protein